VLLADAGARAKCESEHPPGASAVFEFELQGCGHGYLLPRVGTGVPVVCCRSETVEIATYAAPGENMQMMMMIIPRIRCFDLRHRSPLEVAGCLRSPLLDTADTFAPTPKPPEQASKSDVIMHARMHARMHAIPQA
jgi:hypothetical protein